MADKVLSCHVAFGDEIYMYPDCEFSTEFFDLGFNFDVTATIEWNKEGWIKTTYGPFKVYVKDTPINVQILQGTLVMTPTDLPIIVQALVKAANTEGLESKWTCKDDQGNLCRAADDSVYTPSDNLV
jgi:hypothetical protein